MSNKSHEGPLRFSFDEDLYILLVHLNDHIHQEKDNSLKKKNVEHNTS